MTVRHQLRVRSCFDDRLLRNCSLDDLAGREVDQAESEMLRALAETADDAGAALRIAGIGAGAVGAEDSRAPRLSADVRRHQIGRHARR